MSNALMLYNESAANAVVKEVSTSDYDDKIEENIPGMIYTISLTGGADKENNPIFSNVNEFKLPNAIIEGRKSGGGVLTSSLAEALKSGGKKKKMGQSCGGMTWADLLKGVQDRINSQHNLSTQVVTLSMSRPIDVMNEPARISTLYSNGIKRALLIAVQYEGDDDGNAHLSTCHDDLRAIRRYLIHEQGFEKHNILNILDDNGRHHIPTKQLVMKCLTRLCEISEPGDSMFVLFSGHGGRMNDKGMSHQLLATVDYHVKGIGPIIDDELYSAFVTKIPAGVECVAVFDPLHPTPSGGKCSAMELPYFCKASDKDVYVTNGFNPDRLMIASVAVAVSTAAGVTAASKAKTKKKDKSEKSKKKKKKSKEKKTKKKKKERSDNEEGSDDPSKKENELDDEGGNEEAEKTKTKKKSKKTKGEIDDKNENSSASEKEEKKKKKKKKASSKNSTKQVEPNISDDGEDGDDSNMEENESRSQEEVVEIAPSEKRKKKKGLFGLRTKKDRVAKTIESVDNVESDDGKPAAKESKKKKSGLFALRK